MNITAAEIARVTAELEKALTGAFFQKLVQTASDEWVFKFRKGGGNFNLVLTLSPANSRIHLISEEPGEKAEAGSFGKTLKKLTLRSTLISLEQLNNDRIVRLCFNAKGGRRVFVIAELMGPQGNMYLVDDSGMVMAIALPRKSRNAQGKPYVLPEIPAGSDKGPAQPDTAGVTPKAFVGPDFPFNARLEERYRLAVERERAEREMAAALAPLKAELKKNRKRLKDLAKEKEALLSYADDRKLGDLLQANFHLLRKGTSAVEVADIFSPDGKPLKIDLDPAIDPAENVRRRYKRYRKYEKGVPRVEQEIAAIEAREREIDEQIELIGKGDIKTPSKKHPKAVSSKKAARSGERKQQPSGPRRFVTSDGYLALVGRSDRENDEITFRMANGRDLWLHARDYPGSHVLVRLPKGADIPAKTLREAAMLALHYSKAAKSGKGEVTYCRAKDVKKPKGAAAGKALVTGAKSVFARIDAAVMDEMKKRAEEME